jgi:hypothetical protein
MTTQCNTLFYAKVYGHEKAALTQGNDNREKSAEKRR